MMALSMDQGEKDMRSAAEHLISLHGVSGNRVGAVGFYLGGGLAVWPAAASPLIGATVAYCYVMPHGKPDFANIRGPVLGHLGTADPFVSPEDAQGLETELRGVGVETTFEFYEGAGHAFFDATNRLRYDPEAAARSWERTVSFLRDHLTGETA